MVGSGSGAVEELETAAVAVRAFDDEALEFAFINETGAGTGNEGAAGFHQLDGEAVEVFVFLAPVVLVIVTTPSPPGPTTPPPGTGRK